LSIFALSLPQPACFPRPIEWPRLLPKIGGVLLVSLLIQPASFCHDEFFGHYFFVHFFFAARD
jgi:hypothetical protein